MIDGVRANAGVYYYGVREYSPQLGRFLSPDPSWSDHSNPQAANLYIYALNNPYKYTDPTGKVPFLVVTGLIGGVVGGVTAALQYQNLNGLEFAAKVAGGVGVGLLAGMTLGGSAAVELGLSATASVTSVATGAYLTAGALSVIAIEAEVGALGTSRAGIAPKAPLEVNEASISRALSGSNMSTAQSGVSVPAVERYVRMLERGSVPPPIKVDGSVIVDGNHRYVAGRVFGTDPPITPAMLPSIKQQDVQPVQKLQLSPVDWGNE